MNRLPAIYADHPHEPLRQDAIESRDEVVGIDAHVQKTAQHIHNVIRVNGREDKVAGQRRLNCNLRRFHITNFSYHDFVRIVPEN